MSGPKHIVVARLKAMMDQGKAPILVDVLPPEYFQARHIPGAVNCCVYEMAFLDRMREAFPDRGAPIVVQSASQRCMGARDAAGKLLLDGYADVSVCLEGLAGWLEAGFPVEGTLEPEPDSPDVLAPRGRRLAMDPAASRIEWTGRNRTGRHVGTAALAHGEIGFDGERLSSGRFTVDMQSLRNEDLEDRSLADLLVAHLSSHDFFLVDAHPTALFEATHILPLPWSTPGTPNYEVLGNLTLRGQTNDLRFQATVERLDDGRLALEAHFDLDRTRWGAVYGSGRFFEKLGMHLVHDTVSMRIRLVSAPWQ